MPPEVCIIVAVRSSKTPTNNTLVSRAAKLVYHQAVGA